METGYGYKHEFEQIGNRHLEDAGI